MLAGFGVVGEGCAIRARFSVYGAQEAGGPEFVWGAEFGGGEVPVCEVGCFLQFGVAVGGWGVGGGEVGAGGDVGCYVWVCGDVEVGGDDDGDAVCEGVGGESGEEGGEGEGVEGGHGEAALGCAVERGDMMELDGLLIISSEERENLCVECDVLRGRALRRVIISRMS